MDGGECADMKRIFLIAVCLCLLGVSGFSAFAQGDTGEFYSEYDDYYEMEQDYLESVLDDTEAPPSFNVNIPAMAAGAVIATLVAFVVLRKHMRPPMAAPYFRKIETEHRLITKTDNKTER